MNYGNRPTEAPGIAAETAAADIRAILGTDRAPSGQEAPARATHQNLLDWALERGRIFSDLGDLGIVITGGVEHELWHDANDSRVFKITVPGSYGRIPRMIGGRLAMCPGQILEYLDRLALSDLLFADGQKILGVVKTEDDVRILTEQPVVVGERPKLEEIRTFMKSHGFTQAGAEPVYFSEQYRIVIFDCHQGNFLQYEGQIFPFDVIPVRAGRELMAAVQAM